jgi:hypothetical protein
MARARARPRPRPSQPSTAVRNLRRSQYAYPKPGGKGRGKYPIDTVKRFRAALAYAGRPTTAGSRAMIVRRGLKAPNPAVRAAARRARARGVSRPRRRRR